MCTMTFFTTYRADDTTFDGGTYTTDEEMSKETSYFVNCDVMFLVILLAAHSSKNLLSSGLCLLKMDFPKTHVRYKTIHAPAFRFL